MHKLWIYLLAIFFGFVVPIFIAFELTEAATIWFPAFASRHQRWIFPGIPRNDFEAAQIAVVVMLWILVSVIGFMLIELLDLWKEVPTASLAALPRILLRLEALLDAFLSRLLFRRNSSEPTSR